VAWEERGGRRYYYRSVRDGGRVRKEYVGAGYFAELSARSDEIVRARRESKRCEDRDELERLEDLVAPAWEVREAAAVLARASLVAAGYHRHKGEYRRERGA
jgi:hypothetical protein